MSQLSFFSAPPVSRPNWRPEAPPSLAGIGDVCLDTETTGLRWWDKDRPIGISIRPTLESSPLKAQYLPWGHAGGNLSEETVKEWARRELRGKKITGLNIKFDCHMLRVWGVDLEAQGCTLGDVGHYAALLDDHRRSFSLESIAQDYLGRGKVEGLDKTRMASYHAGDVEEYARRDVDLVFDLLKAMEPKLEAEDLSDVCNLEDELIFAVCEMEKNACFIDRAKLKLWVAQSEQMVNRLTWDIYKESGVKTDVGSVKDLEFLFHKLGLHNPYRTNGPRPRASFTDEILGSYEHPVIAKVRQIRKLKSLRAKFLLTYDGQVGDDNLLRYALHQLRGDDAGTVSGRFSSSALIKSPRYGVNIQQVMDAEKQVKKSGDEFVIRDLFVPKNGLFFSADAMQIEYRGFAHLTNSPVLINAYREDPRVDFHNFVWTMLKRYRPTLTRKDTKNVNFALIFGAGIRKEALMLGVSEAVAQEIFSLYHRTFPEVQKLMRETENEAKQQGYVTTFLGRRSRFPNGENTYKALNRKIQGGMTGDYMKMKTIEVHRERKRTGATLRAVIHDEVIGDVPDAESARMVAEILDRQSVPEFRVPILWDMKTGANWREC